MDKSNIDRQGYLVSLEQLLRLIYDFAVSRACGTLEVAGRRRRWEAGFGRGHLRSLWLPDGGDRPLGMILMNEGLIDRAELEESLNRAKSRNMLQGQVLVARGLDPATLWEALKTQAIDRFDRFLKEARGLFSFRPETRLGARQGLGVPVDVLSTLRERTLRGTHKTDGQSWRRSVKGRLFRVVDTRTPPQWSLTAQELACLRAASAPTRLEKVLCSVSDPDGALEFLQFLDAMGALEFLDTQTTTNSEPSARRDETAVPQTLTELRRWWHKTARQYHPDLYPQTDSASRKAMSARFVQLKKKYEKAMARLKT